MANYCTQISFVMPLTKEQGEWGLGLADALRDVCEAGCDAGDLELVGFGSEIAEIAQVIGKDQDRLGVIVEKDENGLWFHAEGQPNLELIATLIQEIMDQFDITEPLGFEWAQTSERPLLDAYGGGAVLVTRKGTEWICTGNWLHKQLQAARDLRA